MLTSTQRSMFGLAGVLALLAASAPLGRGASSAEPVSDQGWTPKQAQPFYDADQGSRLIPQDWLSALEQPAGGGMFLNKRYIQSFHYLPGAGALPIGFAISADDDSGLVTTKLRWKANQGSREPWVGMTCAACHTNDIQVGARTMRVDGGSTLADFQSFFEAFDAALVATRDEPARFDRFARKVLGASATAADKQRLHLALNRFIQDRQKLGALDRTGMRYGPARLDAVGYIYNKVEIIANPEAPSGPPPDAPVSYPFLWNVSQQTRIQWDGVGHNTPVHGVQTFDVGALGRNLAEVTGVFGDVVIPADPHARYMTSLQVSHLVSIEQQLMTLKAPKWPRDAFPIDAALATEGKALYVAQCSGCHRMLARDDLKTRKGPEGGALETMSYLVPKAGEGKADTDIAMACNAVMDTAPTGRLNGRKTNYAGGPAVFGDTAPMTVMLQSVVVNEMLAKAGAISLAAVNSFIGLQPTLSEPPKRRALMAPMMVGAYPGEDLRRAKCLAAAAGPKRQAFGYKARPLNGVWATGPFLHNGSVPTLYDLLLPVDRRPSSFALGSRVLDAKKVGFVTTPGGDNSFVFHVRDGQGGVIRGNSNEGHDFDNAKLTDHQRWALVEYMKVVGEQ